MATQVSGYTGQINPGNGKNYAIGSTAYGYCQTAAETAAKVVDMTGFTLVTGATIFVKFQYANNVANPTLNVNGTGAKPLYRYGTTTMNTGTSTNGWVAGAVLALTYDGTGWVEHYWQNTNVSHTHGLSLATDSGTSSISLAANTKYKLTAGGSTYIFTTPTDTWRGIQDNLTSDSATDSLSAKQGKALKTLVDGKAASSHTHDDRYYTESEIDTKLNSKANLASPALTGTPTAPTAADGTNSTQIATTAFVQSAFKANDAMIFKGTIGSSGATVTALPTTHYQGWTYKVITAGSYAGEMCEIGDMIICVTDGTSENDAHWVIVQSNVDGAVTGPASATDGRIAVFNGTSGKVIKDSGYTIAKSVPSNAKFTDTTYTASTTSIGSASAGTAIAADDITAWDPGSAPTLGTAIAADDITAWSAGTLPSFSCSNGILKFTAGALSALTYTARTIPNVTNVGSVPSLSYTARSIPNISVTSKTVATGITAA